MGSELNSKLMLAIIVAIVALLCGSVGASVIHFDVPQLNLGDNNTNNTTDTNNTTVNETINETDNNTTTTSTQTYTTYKKPTTTNTSYTKPKGNSGSKNITSGSENNSSTNKKYNYSTGLY